MSRLSPKIGILRARQAKAKLKGKLKDSISAQKCVRTAGAPHRPEHFFGAVIGKDCACVTQS